VASEVTREFEESYVFLVYLVENADGTDVIIRQADDAAPGTTQFALQRLHLHCRRMEVPLKQFLENVHG